MVQSGGLSFFFQDEEGNITVWAITVKVDPEEEAPIITDNLGHEYVVKGEQ